MNINRIIEYKDIKTDISESKRIIREYSEDLIIFLKKLRLLRERFHLSSIYKEKNIPKFKWHHQFYDRILMDNEGLDGYYEYILYNPIKHGVAEDPFDFPWIYIRDSEDFRGGKYYEDAR